MVHLRMSDPGARPFEPVDEHRPPHRRCSVQPCSGRGRSDESEIARAYTGTCTGVDAQRRCKCQPARSKLAP